MYAYGSPDVTQLSTENCNAMSARTTHSFAPPPQARLFSAAHLFFFVVSPGAKYRWSCFSEFRGEGGGGVLILLL